MHAGSKPEHGEEGKKNHADRKTEKRKVTWKDPANTVPRISVLWGNSANDCTTVLQSA